MQQQESPCSIIAPKNSHLRIFPRLCSQRVCALADDSNYPLEAVGAQAVSRSRSAFLGQCTRTQTLLSLCCPSKESRKCFALFCCRCRSWHGSSKGTAHKRSQDSTPPGPGRERAAWLQFHALACLHVRQHCRRTASDFSYCPCTRVTRVATGKIHVPRQGGVAHQAAQATWPAGAM